MKHFQFEVKSTNNLVRELARIKRHCENQYYKSLLFQVFTELEDEAVIRDITDVIEAEFPDAMYYGCQTNGNIFEGRLSTFKTTIVCTVFEHVTSNAEFIYIDPDDENSRYRSLQDVWDFCNRNKWVKGVELMPSYKASQNLEFGKPIENLRADVKVFGGVAICPSDPGNVETYIFSKGRGMSDTAAIAVVIGGDDLYVDCTFIRGWEGFGKRFTITDCEGNVIREIDHEPAMDIYRKYLNIIPGDKFIYDGIAFPFLVEENGVECIRNTLTAPDPDDVIVMKDLKNGMSIRLSYGEKKTILKHIRDRLSFVTDFAPEAVRIYSCAGRRMFWGDEDISEESEVFDEIASTVGFYTKGEIIRIDDYLHYMNSTMVLAVAREGEPQSYNYDIEDLTMSDGSSGIGPRLISYISAITKELEGEYSTTMKNIASIYSWMFLIDMDKKELTQLDSDTFIKNILSQKDEYSDKMKNFVQKVISEEDQREALVFAELSTLRARLLSRNSIDCEFMTRSNGWVRVQFIVVSRNTFGIPERFVFTTQIIDDEKRKEELLIHRANTDELTGLFNRRAYEEDLYATKIRSVEKQSDFSLIEVDINGLKVVNDTMGHTAGDEIIIGTADCIRRCLAIYGKAYRIGGDEFAIVVYGDSKNLARIIDDFNQTVDSWSGSLVKSLSVSVGYVNVKELDTVDVDKMIKIADERMYKAKEAYYRSSGTDRRGQRTAYDVLGQLYVKILKINLTYDSYSIVKAFEEELHPEKGFDSKSISRWFRSVCSSDIVHDDDKDKLSELMSIDNLRDYFDSEDKRLVKGYKRLIGGEYKDVILEIIPTKEFLPRNKEVFLYVREL